jgi:hypothetical protein
MEWKLLSQIFTRLLRASRRGKLGRIMLTLVLTAYLFADVRAQDTLGGIMWFPEVQLSQNDNGEDSPYRVRIANSGPDTIHVIWVEDYAVNYQAYRQSTDGGRSWGPVRELFQNPIPYPDGAPPGWTSISTEYDRVVVIAGGFWSPHVERLTFFVSFDRGTTWDPERRISPDTSAWMICNDQCGDTIVTIYSAVLGQGGGPERMLATTDGGTTWFKPTDTLDWYPYAQLTPGSLHYVKDTSVGGAHEILYKRSKDVGQSYDKATILSMQDGKAAVERDMTSETTESGSTIAVAWRDWVRCQGGLGGCEIHVRESTDNGDSWQPEEVYTDKPTGSGPSIAVRRKMRVVTWEHELLGQASHRGALRLKRPDGTFTPIKLFGSTNVSQPKVTLTDRAVHVAWYDAFSSRIPHTKAYYMRGVFVEHIKRVDYTPSWNLVSTSHIPSIRTTLPSLHSFDVTYRRQDRMEFGKGYWARPDSTVFYEGDPVYVDTLPVIKGWNLIGALSEPVDVATITTKPRDIFMSEFIGYGESGYERVLQIEPGRAYWVKVNQNGQIILHASP